MKFGEIPVAEAAGAILAHSVKLAGRALRKGRVLNQEDSAALAEAGLTTIIAARLAADELGEDEAAADLAHAVAGANVSIANAFTGRANLFAETRGLCIVERVRLDEFNLVDEAATLATLAPYALVEKKQMVATIKIVPFGVKRAIVERCIAIAADGPLIRVAPLIPTDACLIQTRLPGFKESILDKTVEVTKVRLASLDSRLTDERRCAHTVQDLAEQIRAAAADTGLLLIAGASAIVDRRDVIPAAIVECGGMIEHFGMPVDPGNLILLGRLGEVPVLGLPGCARSPKENGFDWVLRRLLAGIKVTREEVMRMGAGGLLAEIPTRPLPRAEAVPTAERPAPQRQPRIAALILAAGQSRRMGEVNKLLIDIGGKPMVRRVAETVLATAATPVIAVLGHERDRVRAAFAGLKLRAIYNPDYAAGISTSLKRGLAALPDDIDGVLVCLGDMPLVGPSEIERLIGAFNPTEGRAIIVPTGRGKRGNPVLWAKRFFPEMQDIAGDVGARHLVGAYPELVAEIEMTGEGVLLDIDTPEALAAYLNRLRSSSSVSRDSSE